MRASKGFGSGGGLGLLALAFAFAALSGCVSTPEKKKAVDPESLVWPGPPEQPRIRFVAEYRGESDFKTDDSALSSLLGDDKRGVHLEKPYGVAASPDGGSRVVTWIHPDVSTALDPLPIRATSSSAPEAGNRRVGILGHWRDCCCLDNATLPKRQPPGKDV